MQKGNAHRDRSHLQLTGIAMNNIVFGIAHQAVEIRSNLPRMILRVAAKNHIDAEIAVLPV